MNNENNNNWNNNIDQIDLEEFEQRYNSNPTNEILYEFLKAYTEDRDLEDYVSDAAAHLMRHLVEHREEIKAMLKAEPFAVLKEMEEEMENKTGGISEKGHFFLGDPMYANNNENGEIIGYDGSISDEDLLGQLETDAYTIFHLIQEVIQGYPKQAANIALGFGQYLPTNITRQIINFHGPSNKNYMKRVNTTYERRAKKAADEVAKKAAVAQEAVQQIQQITPPPQRQVQVSSKKGCLGNRCSIMGGSKKRKTHKRKSKSKKTKRAKKH